MARRGPSNRLQSQAAIETLAELQRAPRHVIVRAVDRLEAGLAELDDQTQVPAGWFLTTASGYNSPKRGRVPASVALADTAALIEALCIGIDMTEAELPDGAMPAAQLAERWGVSERTLHRARIRGLAARSVRVGRTRRLVFAPIVIEAHARRAGPGLERARAFSRMTEAQRDQAIERYRALREQHKPATESARLVAEELGRSAEAIRQLVAAHERAGDRWSDRDRRLALRAHDRFLEPAAIAERLGRKTTAIRRMIDAERLERLHALDIEMLVSDEPPAPRLPLGAPGPTLLADLIAEMRETNAPDRETEHALTTHARFLTSRAAHTIAGVRAAMLRAEPIDAAETDLLWAARLRIEALRPLLGFVLRGVEARLGGEIESLPARVATTRLQLALAAAAEAAHRYDPARGGRLSAAVTIAVDRVAGTTPAGSAKPTAARRSFAQWRVEDWTRRVSPWQRFLEAPATLRAGMASLDAKQRAILESRFGFGERPHTLAEISERLGIHRPWVGRRVREAARAALVAGRAVWASDTIGP